MKRTSKGPEIEGSTAPVRLRAFGSRAVGVDGDDLAVGRQRAAHPERRVAERRPDLEDAPGAHRRDAHAQESAHRVSHDRDVLAAALCVDARQDGLELGMEAIEVLEIGERDGFERIPHVGRPSSSSITAQQPGSPSWPQQPRRRISRSA
ncbi:MAG: hypothetical protein AUH85_17470 [Chloroflexi bacterium 13_1_40CM_4_68_4]|nr:MAG: hypothetical protein AUH85_17470 [Chloroflexi bacterium 13_1_40CM_4_68_4]